MKLEVYIQNRRKKKEILLMTHIVIGYPSFEDCFKIIKSMVEGGVDLMELQIPFSEPIADGPVILRANHEALRQGATVQTCLDFAGEVAHTFDIPFLIMTYYNIPFKYGVDGFISAMSKKDLKGAIIPDLPPEEGRDFLEAMKEQDLAPVLVFSPTTPFVRMKYLSTFSKGLIYCVARKGVTGAHTSFSNELVQYLEMCRRATSLPLALGFGVKKKADMDFLKGKADIAVIGTQTIQIMETKGLDFVGPFIRSLF